MAIINNLPISGDNLSDNILTYFCGYPYSSSAFSFVAPSLYTGVSDPDYVYFNQSSSSSSGTSGGFYLRKKMKTRLKTYNSYTGTTVTNHYTYILEPGYVYTYTIGQLQSKNGYYRADRFAISKYDITDLGTRIDNLYLQYAADEERNSNTMFRLERA